MNMCVVWYLSHSVYITIHIYQGVYIHFMFSLCHGVVEIVDVETEAGL